MPPPFYNFKIMKKYISLLMVVAVVALLASCSHKRKEQTAQELLRPASMDYTQKDTADINYLVNTYVGYFGKGDLESCANMLYIFRNDSAIPYTQQQKDNFKKAFSQFHFYGSRVKNMILRSDRNNEVNILLQIISNGSLAEERGVTTLTLNPVVVKGKWYLTLMDKDAQGVEDVYKQELENARR